MNDEARDKLTEVARLLLQLAKDRPRYPVFRVTVRCIRCGNSFGSSRYKVQEFLCTDCNEKNWKHNKDTCLTNPT